MFNLEAKHASIAVSTALFVAVAMSVSWQYLHEPHAVAHRIDFNRDIRPILNKNCNSCHGGVKQQGGVSFIYREEALGKGKSGRPTVVPGRPNASELIARVTSTDPETRMPYRTPALPPQQVTLLRQWIEEGAQWEDYWAFVAPRPQPLPDVKETVWLRQPLDRFIVARLERESLTPSPEADKAELLRRASFDLIGLPPKPEELSAFLADPSSDAYERQVDRLLASPHYGERWASMWLDLARYADTRGYDVDFARPGVWPYRDWVIDAFNRNMPFDRFVITQLAGDLLPNPTFEDLIATSFNRQTPANDEDGTDDEEYRLVAAMDRVATTWATLNGVTINCAQCHSHPYDPIRHAEYYKFLAFYNTARDADLDRDDSPALPIPKEHLRRAEATSLRQQMVSLLRKIVDGGKFMEAQTAWTPLPVGKAVVDEALALERYLDDLKLARREGRNPFAGSQADAQQVSAKELRKYWDMAVARAIADLDRARRTGILPLETRGGGVRTVGTVPTRSVYELLTERTRATLTALRIEVPAQDPGKARHTPEDGFIVDQIEAWVLPSTGQQRKLEFRYFVPDSEENLASAARSEAAQKANAISAGVDVFAANSKLFRTRWVVAVLDEVLPPGSRLKLHLSYSRQMGGKPSTIKHLRLAASSDARWNTGAEETAFRRKLAELIDVERRLAAIPSVPLPVMTEQRPEDRRETLLFERGNFLTKVGLPLAPDVPALFPELAEDAPRNRLTMAQWFFAPRQPLTARVAVNRYWEQLFGTGIVETLEDFGSAGELPSHPELLDWLALHFQHDLHWDMKRLLKELVTSSTYRQTAKTSAALLERDPRNRLLARGPQQRLTAEMVRDQVLAASGLLTTTIGGPPVMPPQPASVSADHALLNWVDATGADRYRRAIYTFLKRTGIYPSLDIFDASGRSVSLPRRIPTNTPLQALVTLNDPVYHEAAEALARRIMAEPITKIDVSRVRPNAAPPVPNTLTTLDRRLIYATQRVLSRDPTPLELESLQRLYKKVAERGTTKSSTSAADRELAAWTVVSSVLLNLDAALTR